MLSEPIFIVAPPRSGSIVLLEALWRSSDVLALPGAIDSALAARCVNRERLTAADAPLEMAAALRDELSTVSGDARLVDASPRNILRVPFLHAVFPEAKFVFVYREPRRAIHEWRNTSDEPTEELAHRWNRAISLLLDDLGQLPPDRWAVADHRQLVSEPARALARLSQFLGVKWDGTLPPVRAIAEKPPDEVIAELDRVDTLTRAVAARARDCFAEPPVRAVPKRPHATEATSAPGPSSFRSVATSTFASLLQRLGISLLVSTYQSGRLILVRAENETTLNTHFRMFRSPMGVAVGNDRIAVGTEREVWDYRNQPAVAPRVEPLGKHDACFVPRKIHVTGDIRIHEIGFAAGELWIVNTRFSALCTLDLGSSFVPRWRPPFVTHLAPEDRCHLNGMAIIDNRVRFVTAFGTTNTAGGWREKKATGGVLLDVDSGEVVLSGLSMPHSPRQYDGRFYLLESGKGTIATADLATGHLETMAELPGFTRGLAFRGPFAFIGLSQVRESNVFGGIPLTERVAERQCGVYVVDLRNGETVAFLRFEGDVQEIFDVQILPARFPELLELTSPLTGTSFTVPDAALADVLLVARRDGV
jgi:uncharacterized protein (TIGR03032 family)